MKDFRRSSIQYKHLEMCDKNNFCGQPYSKEPGFYFGAMYGLCIRGRAFCCCLLFTYLFFLPCLPLNIFIVALLSLLLAPYFFHYQKLFMQISFGNKSNKK